MELKNKKLADHSSTMPDMRCVAPTVSRALGVRPPSSSERGPHYEVVSTLKATDRLVVVVVDAFGYSTWKAVKELTPCFNTLHAVHGAFIDSMMPTITPVNFATMLTGASPANHGITNREQPLALETVFHALRGEGMTSATAARAMSSLGILISPHADRPGIAASNTDDEVTRIALKALEGEASLLWVQLLDVDDAGHAHGPLSQEGYDAASRADSNLRKILGSAHRGGYSAIVLADHGQHTVEKEGRVQGTHGTDMPQDIVVPLAWTNNDELGDIG
jgi:predicted AlkP superfamily pyrophosphatase or phosphodiesterase